MRGIFGIFQKNGQAVTPGRMAPMQAIMELWGQNGTRTHCHQQIGLGQSLAHLTTEPKTERWPITHPQAPDLFITADARIDNRKELCEMLAVPASERLALTDSALILLAYAKWEQDCVEKLIGAFAFVIWDQQRKRLFCGRDHMGLRPFFYYNGPECFVFASDIEAVLACPAVPQRLNQALLAAHLQEDTYFAEKRQTFWIDIVKLPPAHHLSLTPDAHQLCRYWSLENIREVRLPSNTAYAQQLRDLLFQAVECRIQTDFPIGAHLSGGLDSSSVAAIAAQHLQQQGKTVETYSWSPPPIENDEVTGNEHDFIRALCKQYSLNCNFIDLTVEDVVRTYRRDFTRVPYEMMLREELVLNQASQDGMRVMLSGWGGDETVTGHGWGCLSSQFLHGHWHKLHRELRAFTTTENVSSLKQAVRYARMFYHKVLIPLIPEPVVVQLTGRQSSYPENWINPQFAEAHHETVQKIRGLALRERPGVQHMQWRWLDNGHITKRIESWAINGARRGVSYRYPLLDRRVLEFCLGVPPDQFVQNGWKRSLIRRAMDGLLPPKIQWNRSKMMEHAAFDMIGRVMVAALPELRKRLQENDHFHDIAQYVDLKRLAEAVDTTKDFDRSTEALAITFACANVCTKVTE